jgi:hypothetical protein
MPTLPITEFRNAKSLNTYDTMFDVEINHPHFGWIPYTLLPHDTDMTVNNDNLLALIGSDFLPYVSPTQDELDAKQAENVRSLRDYELLEEVDPLVLNSLRWSDLTDEQRTAWSQYRTDLLNVPQQDGFPHNVIWPTRP